MDAKGVLRFLKLEGLLEHLSGYVEDKAELLKLELQEDIASFGANLLIIIMMLIFGLCCLLFISIAFAILLNILLDHTYFGYFIMGGVYLIFTFIAFGLKNNNQIKSMFYKVISKSFDKE